MAGLMILSARFRAAGFYDAAADWIARRAGRPLWLLALTIFFSGVLSALLINDTSKPRSLGHQTGADYCDRPSTAA